MVTIDLYMHKKPFGRKVGTLIPTCTHEDACVYLQMCVHAYGWTLDLCHKGTFRKHNLALTDTRRGPDTHTVILRNNPSLSLPLPVIASQPSHDAAQRGPESQLPCVRVQLCSPDPVEEWTRIHLRVPRCISLFQEHAGRGQLIVNKSGRAGRRTRGCRARSASWMFLEGSLQKVYGTKTPTCLC